MRFLFFTWYIRFILAVGNRWACQLKKPHQFADFFMLQNPTSFSHFSTGSNQMLPVLEHSKRAKNSLIFQKCAKCTLTLMSNYEIIFDYKFRFYTSKMNWIRHLLYFSSIILSFGQCVCLKINIPKGNYWILRIGVVASCQKLGIIEKQNMSS